MRELRVKGIKVTLNRCVCADRPISGCHVMAGGAIFCSPSVL